MRPVKSFSARDPYDLFDVVPEAGFVEPHADEADLAPDLQSRRARSRVRSRAGVARRSRARARYRRPRDRIA
jgi:hypothetical protein